MPDPLVVPGAPGVPGAETPGQPATATELLDQYDKALFDLIVIHGKVQMDTAQDKALHARVVGTWLRHLAALRTARNDAGLPRTAAPTAAAGRPVAHTEKGERR